MTSISILGSGWLGLALAKELSKQYNIKLSTTKREKLSILEDKNTAPFLIDINNINENIKSFLDSSILIVNITSKDTASFEKLLKFTADSSIKKVIFISSTSVYQNCSCTVKEDDKELYSDSPLLDIENIFLGSPYFKTTILRFAGLFGYDRNPAKFFKNGRTVKAPESPVNMIHRDDCINIIKEILQKDIFGETFNCCASSHPSKKEFYSHFAKISNLPAPDFEKNTKEEFKIVENSKLLKKLNYTFIHDDLLRFC